MLIFSDAHLHVNPVKGLGAFNIAKKFKKEGGWFMAIVSLPPYHYGLTEIGAESYKKIIQLLNKEAEIIKNENIKVVKLAGIHPAEIDEYYKQGLRGEKLFRILENVLKLLESALKSNIIDGIGEVGRQHYGTSPERLVFSEVIMIKAMELARDYDSLLHLHLEQGGFITTYSIKILVEKIGVKFSRTILHHVNYDTASWSERIGMPFTIPIKHFDEKYASINWSHGMIESDYIDDLQRPGVSAYPWDIPRIINNYVRSNIVEEEKAYKILVDNVVKFYRIRPP
ncbi:MAG: TatD family hydrolase [Desulfurococcaceae archaeon]